MSTNAMHSVHSMQCNTMQNIQHNALRLPIWFLLCCNTIQCINELMNWSTMPLQFNVLSCITAKRCRVDSSCQHEWIYRALHLIGHWGVFDCVQVWIQVPQPASLVSRDARVGWLGLGRYLADFPCPCDKYKYKSMTIWWVRAINYLAPPWSDQLGIRKTHHKLIASISHNTIVNRMNPLIP